MKITKPMAFQPLPPLDSEPLEEKEANFKNKLQHLIITDEKYNEEIKKIHDKDLDDQDQISELEADDLEI